MATFASNVPNAAVQESTSSTGEILDPKLELCNARQPRSGEAGLPRQSCEYQQEDVALELKHLKIATGLKGSGGHWHPQSRWSETWHSSGSSRVRRCLRHLSSPTRCSAQTYLAGVAPGHPPAYAPPRATIPSRSTHGRRPSATT